jgi:acyl CoA:acetate/3-ketoacid CoA transferase alpha subunit
VKTTIKAGVPLLAEASVEISYEFSGSYSWGETKSETKQYSSEEEVEVAAHTKLTLRVVATEGACDIPFTYTQEDILTTGETIVTNMGDGIYRGVNSYGFKTVITEKKI